MSFAVFLKLKLCEILLSFGVPSNSIRHPAHTVAPRLALDTLATVSRVHKIYCLWAYPGSSSLIAWHRWNRHWGDGEHRDVPENFEEKTSSTSCQCQWKLGSSEWSYHHPLEAIIWMVECEKLVAECGEKGDTVDGPAKNIFLLVFQVGNVILSIKLELCVMLVSTRKGPNGN